MKSFIHKIANLFRRTNYYFTYNSKTGFYAISISKGHEPAVVVKDGYVKPAEVITLPQGMWRRMYTVCGANCDED